MNTPSIRSVGTLIFSLILLASSGCSRERGESQPDQNNAIKGEVNVYSARQEELIKPLLDKFTESTGIEVNLVTGKGDALLTRLQSEGGNSPADLLLTVDAGRLHRAKEAGVLQAIDAPELNARVPAYLRDPEGFWYGLSMRARVIMYAPDRVDASALSTYEALTDAQWQGRICIRSSGNIYNQSMTASFLAHLGEEATDAWLGALVPNFARPPQGGDRDQIRAVAAGVCDLAVANSYYLGAMLNSDDAGEREAAQSVAVFFPNQDDRGTHVNISGAGVTQSAPNLDNAIALLTFLTSDSSQAWYAETNSEYPVRKDVAVSETLAAWGSFKQDELPMEKLGKLNKEAVKAMDRAGWK